MDCDRIVFSAHALQRLFERSLALDEVVSVIREGEVIASYPDDTPFPSAVVLGFVRGRPLHVVVAREPPTGVCVLVTAYIPDPERWTPDFRSRRP